MKKITLLTFLLVFCAMNAQIEYDLTVLNEPYVNLEGATSLNNGEIWDDPGYVVPLGFDFQLGASIVNTIFVQESGLGGLVSTTINIENPSVGFFAPVLQDIIDRGANSSTSISPISFRVDGNSGNRILKLEWNNAGFFDNFDLEDFVNFQLWLYEAGDIIEYRYGPSEINNPVESFEGLTGLQIALFPLLPNDDIEGDLEQDAYLLSGDPLNPDFNVLSTADDIENIQNMAITGTVPDGTVYRFSSESLSVNDVSSSVDVAIYPNPTSDFFRIKSDLASHSIQIYNVAGLQVRELLEPKQRYDISNLSTGVYFVKVISDAGVVTKRLIKR